MNLFVFYYLNFACLTGRQGIFCDETEENNKENKYFLNYAALETIEKTEMKSIRSIEDKILELKSKLIEKAYELEHATIREAKETHEASLILLRMAKGNEVSKDEVGFLKNQSLDLGKALAIIGLQAVPFSSVAIVAIEVVVNKHGFSLFPVSQTKENINPDFIEK